MKKIIFLILLNSFISKAQTSKKWVIFGDSFSDGYSTDYVDIVNSNLGFSNSIINGKGGDKIKNQIDVLSTLLAKDSIYMVNFDIATLLIGVNDYVAGTPLGTIKDSSNDKTYARGLKYFIETILKANPKVKLFIMTPPEANNALVKYKSANKSGWTLEEMANLIKQICESYAVQYIDLYSISQFNLQTIPKLTTDGLHPNAAGAKTLGDIISKKLKD